MYILIDSSKLPSTKVVPILHLSGIYEYLFPKTLTKVFPLEFVFYPSL